MGNYASKDSVEKRRDIENIKKNISEGTIKLNHLSSEEKDNEELVSFAIDYNNTILYASDRLRDNKNIVFKAVSRDGNELTYASDLLKNDITIVMKAIEQTGYALGYASSSCRANKKIVTKAIEKSGEALQYASENLKDDFTMIEKAIQIDHNSIKYASDRLKKNKKLVYQSCNISYRLQKHIVGHQFAFLLKNNTKLIYRIFKLHIIKPEPAYEWCFKNNFYLRGFKYPRKLFLQYVKKEYDELEYMSLLKMNHIKNDPRHIRMKLLIISHRNASYIRCFNKPLNEKHRFSLFPYQYQDISSDRQCIHLRLQYIDDLIKELCFKEFFVDGYVK